jgi:hypothetical protein
MSRLVRIAMIVAVLAPMLAQSPPAVAQGGAISACLKFLKEYFFKPVAQGASEALGYELVEQFMDSKDRGEIAPSVPPPTPAELAPRGEIDDAYVAYLRDLGFSDCQIREATGRALGPPAAEVYN